MRDYTENTENKSPKKSFRNRLKAAGILLCLVSLFAGWYFVFYRVVPVGESFTYELGESVSTDVKDYVRGFFKATSFSKLDISNVKENKCGTYKAYVKHFPHTYEFKIKIKDSTAPVVLLSDSEHVLERKKSYTPEDVVASVIDEDEVSLKFLNTSTDSAIHVTNGGESVSFSSNGSKSISIQATDRSGNTSTTMFNVLVDDAPIIYTYDTFYTVCGEPVDFEYWADDYVDGDLTEKVSVKMEEGCFDVIGKHNITFSVTDSYGLTTDLEASVCVLEPEILQDLVNTGRVSGFAPNVCGVINPYDAGYVVADDIVSAREGLIPATVRISFETAYVRSFGSGYILKITDDEIIIGTNQHVVSDQKKVNVSFSNGEKAVGKVVARKKKPDMAFVSVKIADIPSYMLSYLKTVHINLNYYRTLSNAPEFAVGMYCTDGMGEEWLTNYGTIVRKTGKLSQYFENFNYPVTEVSVDLVPGVSGSMIFDSHGNFVCMASFFWEHGIIKENYGVSLDDILDFYEETFGERLEYY